MIWLRIFLYLIAGTIWLGANKEVHKAIFNLKEEASGTKLLTTMVVVVTWPFWAAWQIGEYLNKSSKP